MDKENYPTRPRPLLYFLRTYPAVLMLLLLAVILELIALPAGVVEVDVASAFLLFALLFLAASAVYSVLFCRFTGIAIDQFHLDYKTGIINSRKQMIPLDLVSDTSIETNLIDKLIHSATLVVVTVGSTAYNIRIPGLEYETADAFHDKLHEKMRLRGKGMRIR